MVSQFLIYLKTLPLEDWDRKIDRNWTVKDVVAHLVGWEEECTAQLPVIWKTKKAPWFLDEAGDDEFNRKSIDKYKELSPKELLGKWQTSIARGKKEANAIGEKNLKAYPELFDWWFDTGHYEHHFKQIKDKLMER